MKHLRSLVMLLTLVMFGWSLGALAQDSVNVRFSWKLKGEYGALYMAQEAGHYKKANLAVRLGEGAGAPAALGALIQGRKMW